MIVFNIHALFHGKFPSGTDAPFPISFSYRRFWTYSGWSLLILLRYGDIEQSEKFHVINTLRWRKELPIRVKKIWQLNYFEPLIKTSVREEVNPPISWYISIKKLHSSIISLSLCIDSLSNQDCHNLASGMCHNLNTHQYCRLEMWNDGALNRRCQLDLES